MPMNYDIKSMLESKSENLCVTNENYYSVWTSEFDNPIHNITTKVVVTFMKKFPKECIALVNILI